MTPLARFGSPRFANRIGHPQPAAVASWKFMKEHATSLSPMEAAKQMSKTAGRELIDKGSVARGRRLAAEAKLIAEARAGAVKGETVSDERVNAWIDSLGTDHELPVPQPER